MPFGTSEVLFVSGCALDPIYASSVRGHLSELVHTRAVTILYIVTSLYGTNLLKSPSECQKRCLGLCPRPNKRFLSLLAFKWVSPLWDPRHDVNTTVVEVAISRQVVESILTLLFETYFQEK